MSSYPDKETDTIVSQSPSHYPESDFANYSGNAREVFLSPIFLKQEKFYVYKGLNFLGRQDTQFVVTLDEYQGLKFKPEMYSGHICHLNLSNHKTERKVSFLSKKRSKSHSNPSSSSQTEQTKQTRQRRYTSYDSKLKESLGTSFSQQPLLPLPRKPSASTNFDLLGNLEGGLDGSGSENAIEEDAELLENYDDPTQEQSDFVDVVDGNYSKGTDDPNEDLDENIDEEEDEDGYGDEDNEDEENESDEFDDAIYSSDDDNHLPMSHRYGYPYVNRVPVIDVLVSDCEDVDKEFDVENSEDNMSVVND